MLLGIIIFIFIFGVLFYISNKNSSKENKNNCTPNQHTFPNFNKTLSPSSTPNTAFQTKTGGKSSLKDFYGKGLVVNFWATWCAPCVREMPSLNRLAALTKENNIKVLTISEDRKGIEVVASYIKKNQLYDLPILIDEKGALFQKFKLHGLPSTILINNKNEEVGRIIGEAIWDSKDSVNFIRNCLGK